MKVKIVSDGTPRGTIITDADTGMAIENVQGITWKLNIYGLAHVNIELIDVEIEATGETE